MLIATEPLDKMADNPFIYEDQIVVSPIYFGTMLDKDVALFSGKKSAASISNLIVAKSVPTTKFSDTKKKYLVAMRVLGKSRYKMPSGSDVLLADADYIGAYEGEYNDKDIKWVVQQVSDK